MCFKGNGCNVVVWSRMNGEEIESKHEESVRNESEVVASRSSATDGMKDWLRVKIRLQSASMLAPRSDRGEVAC